MPAYHSSFNAVKDAPEVCGCIILPLKTRARGPAPLLDVASSDNDIVDEALQLFRANVLFRSFEVQGPSDRLLAYLTLFIHQCIRKCERKTRADAQRDLTTLATGAHVLPGDAAWPLGSLMPAPKPGAETETLRGYLRQLRECVVARLLDRLYDEAGAPNKHWLAFSKRKFMNKEFAA